MGAAAPSRQKTALTRVRVGVRRGARQQILPSLGQRRRQSASIPERAGASERYACGCLVTGRHCHIKEPSMQVKQAMHKGVRWVDPDTPIVELARA